MGKKHQSKVSPKLSRPKRPNIRGPIVAVIFRISPDTKSWLDDTAAEIGLSRDQFVRMLFDGIREKFSLAMMPGTSEASLFAEFRADARTAMKEAVHEVLKNSPLASVVRLKKGQL